MATSTRANAEASIKTVQAIKDHIESFMDEMYAQSEIHLESFEALSTQVEDLRGQVEDMGRKNDEYVQDTKDLLGDVRNERDMSAYKMGDEMRYADEELDALARDLKEGKK